MVYLDPRQIVAGAFQAFIGAAQTDPIPDVMPADNVAFGSPGGTFRNVGFSTEDGANFGGLSPDSNPVMTGQQPSAVTVLPGNAEETVGATFIEGTLTNFRDFSGRGAITSQAPGIVGSGTYGHDDWTLSNTTPRFFSLLIEGFGPNGAPRRMFYPSVRARIDGDVQYRQGQPMGIPVVFSRSGGPSADPVWRDVRIPGSSAFL
jgi:hypothetical protein